MHAAGAAVLAKTIGNDGWPSHPDLCACERHLSYECLKTFAYEKQTALGMLNPFAHAHDLQNVAKSANHNGTSTSKDKPTQSDNAMPERKPND